MSANTINYYCNRVNRTIIDSSGTCAVMENVCLNFHNLKPSSTENIYKLILSRDKHVVSVTELTTNKNILNFNFKLNSIELAKEFRNHKLSKKLTFKLLIWNVTDEQLLLNDNISVQNNKFNYDQLSQKEILFTPIIQYSIDGINWLNEKPNSINCHIRFSFDSGASWTSSIFVTGVKGDEGNKGNKGVKGDEGNKGNKGDEGNKGDKGDKGDAFTYSNFTITQLNALKIKGDKGDKGVKGDPFRHYDFTLEQLNALKVKGDKGDKGDKGYKGDKGNSFRYSDFSYEQLNALKVKGDKGETGVKGDKGDKGVRGEIGVKGDKGDKGVRGERGAIGETGETGDKGAKGDRVALFYTDLTPDQKAEITGVKVNADLLINGELDINQRGWGRTGLTWKDYICDTYQIHYNANNTWTADRSNGITSIIADSVASSGHCFSRSPVDFKNTNIRGRNITLTARGRLVGTTGHGGGIQLVYNGEKGSGLSFNETMKTYSVVIPIADEEIVNCYNRIMMSTITEVGQGVEIEFIKVELGDKYTGRPQKTHVQKLLECQHYAQIHSTNDINPIDLVPQMLATPTITPFNGNYLYSV